ncbi:MdtA/MuxA family multidrug efflux RND transporter periplasmic adaptor subunit [Tolumonas lignilytica]|uniref:MdtA/MuxA family multidrug efflux RND transporter periplasmic adaptor subunit n=1 Tax=Tolumonas lignilytica TaxID=1283284 RepID=UPI000467308E|nr:MdtA/MuxA family multidrug efflux RND transporter periplasmic adaptor subunit [Tolumonas lignilytica]
MSEIQTQASSSKLKIYFGLIVIIAGIGGWLYFRQVGQSTNAVARRSPPVSVSVAKAEKQDVPIQLSALGTVNSTYTVTLHSRVDGQLNKIHFDEGQTVKQGQLLAELDPRPYQAALTQTQGQLLRDQALLRNAEIDLARYRRLWAQNSVAKQQVDTQEALVNQYRGTVKLDQGLVANAQLQLSYSRISSPISGRVGLRQVDPGNIVHSSDSSGLVTITQTQPINVLFSIPETNLSQLLQATRQNPQLVVEAWDRDYHTKLATGHLLAIDNQLNTNTGTVSLKAQFANDDQQLFPNQFVNIRLLLTTRKNAVTVPDVAVQTARQGSYVYLLNTDNSISMTPVSVGAGYGDRVIVEKGVQPGQQVVVDGLDRLRNGSKVVVRGEQGKTGGSGQSGQSGRSKGGAGQRAPSNAQ